VRRAADIELVPFLIKDNIAILSFSISLSLKI